MPDILDLLRSPYGPLILYFVTVAIETPVLIFGLSDQHSYGRRLFAGFWLTACTYPLVALVIPEFFHPNDERLAYLLVAESIAHFGECVLFYLAFSPLKHFWRDMITVFSANLASFGFGELMWFVLLPANPEV